MTITFYRITGTNMRCAKIEVRYVISDVRLSKEYWKRFCDNQRYVPSPVGNFPLELKDKVGLNRHVQLAR